jgi:hypothetical protein
MIAGQFKGSRSNKYIASKFPAQLEYGGSSPK